jgi:hypothetical protein
VAAGGAMFVVAAALFVVGLFEETWPDRATVWATALAAAAFSAQLLASAASDRPEDWASLSGPVVREIGAARTWLWVICLVLPFVMTATVSRDGFLPATGDLMLLADANGQVSLVVPLSNGGVASCSFEAASWSSEWSSPRIDPDWGDLGRSSAFFSARGTFQLLGQRDGGLVQGRQDPDMTWHGEYTVLIDSELITSARGRPAYFQHVDPDSRYWYLALVPDVAGGVRLYWRNVHWGRTDLVESGIGLVDSVTAVDDPDEGTKAILRVGDRMFWLTRPPEVTPGDFDQRWTSAEELRTASGSPIRVVGDPMLIRTTGSADNQSYKVAVPTVDGLHLLTAADFDSNNWTVEPLPVASSPESVALIDTTVDGRSSLLVAYRIDDVIYATYTTNGQWHTPQPIRCTS